MKKWEIELGIHHQELGLPWDQPVPKELWEKVAEYCDNDVIATEAVWHDRQEDFIARQVLADLSGLTVNDTTRMHATRIIFGKEKHPDLVYTDLSEEFPGYKFEGGKSSYRGEDPGEGGYVYAEPGMYGNVALLDIASMHPTSIRVLNLFGSYTKNFTDILDARLAIKHGDFEAAGELLNGAFPFFSNGGRDLRPRRRRQAQSRSSLPSLACGRERQRRDRLLHRQRICCHHAAAKRLSHYCTILFHRSGKRIVRRYEGKDLRYSAWKGQK